MTSLLRLFDAMVKAARFYQILKVSESLALLK
ncbi:MAG: hypothetical protein H6R18_2767 [Proteobacteria bacterium]|nr:hypothetical protein [Pseudomonadota bacterium]